MILHVFRSPEKAHDVFESWPLGPDQMKVYTSRRIREKNGEISSLFRVIPSLGEAYLLAGFRFSSLVFHDEVPVDVQKYLLALVRSPAHV